MQFNKGLIVIGAVAGTKYVAKFNRQDVKNVAPGDAVTFTVIATVEYNGQKVFFEGADTIRVR
jgi:hypothetical protein